MSRLTRRWLWLGLLPLGCRGGTPATDDATRVALIAEAPPGDAIVATVDQRPIRASDIGLQAKAAGTTPKQALDDLIAAEALASEAVRRGLDRGRELRRARQDAEVRALLKTVFEPEVTPASIPSEHVKALYERNKNAFDHEEAIDVWHILVPAKRDAPTAERQAALQTATEIARRARGVGRLESFEALASEVTTPAKPLKPEHLITERDGWTVKEFSYPAFALLKRPGDTTPPVETQYGYHVIYLVERLPAEHVGLAQADRRLRREFFPDFQAHEFVEFADRLIPQHRVDVHPERLPTSGAARPPKAP